MKLSITSVALALTVTATVALPIGDIHRMLRTPEPVRLEPGRGDYPDSRVVDRIASTARPAQLA